MAEPEPMGYAAALAELEAILTELEDDEVDVDVLATRITRARELIAICRHRIENARIEVERVQAAEDP
jgi:exodeoxyribonuclease VII small subunit